MDLVGRARRKPTNENNILPVVDAPSGKDAAAVTAAAQKNMNESFFRSLPRACFGFLLAVLFDQCLMLGYAGILLTSGSNTSAYYFAACILLFAFALGYFSLSAVRSENTVELLTAIVVGSGVTATIYYVRLGGDIDNVKRQKCEDSVQCSTADSIPAWVLTAVSLTCQSLVQLVLMGYGYRSYLDFGWRIFKLFGTDLRMRTVYETFLWLKAMLKLDFLFCCLLIAAGIAFFFEHLEPIERVFMALAIAMNLVWVISCYLAVKAEWRRLTLLLLPPAVIVPAYLIFKGYDLYNHVYLMKTDKYEDVWKSPVYATIFFALVTRGTLLRQMWKARSNFGKGLKGFSMHRDYELPAHLSAAMPQALAEGVKAMVKGAMLVGSMDMRVSVVGRSEQEQEAERLDRYQAALKAGMRTHAAEGEAGVELAEREAAEAAATIQPVYKTQQHFFTDRRRFFQLSNDLTTLRWSWKEYLLLDEIVKVCQGPERSCTVELHAGDIFQRRVLTLTLPSPDEASCWLLSMRALLRLTTLGDREFTLYLLDLFKMADRQRVGAITAQNRRMALSFLNLELERTTESSLVAALDMDDSGALDFREFVALVRRLSRLPLLSRLFQKYNGDERYMSHKVFETLWQREQGEPPDEHTLRLFNQCQSAPGMLSESGFVQILTSAANDAADPQLTQQVVQDMGLPLSDYFVASSHNTYLTGDQLRSASGCEMYARCLLQGCRCVEIDCWDGPDGYPDVYHGYTVSTHLKMSDVIQVIIEHAFSASPYPLILSLEVHCSLAQQQTLAVLLQQGLGEALYVPDAEARALRQLPSPEALRYKILLKAKTNELAIEEAEAARADLAEGVGDDDKYAELKLKKGQGQGQGQGQGSSASPTMQPSHEEEGGGSGSAAASPTKQRNRKTSFNISRDNAPPPPRGNGASPALRRGGADVERFHPELCALVSLKVRSKLRPERFSDPGSEYDPWQLASIGELKSFAYLKEHGARWMRHNRCHLCRCFPQASRVDSSNMPPHPFWDAGSSMVALNYQTFDQPMQINQGKFRLNGGCGWLLKPVHLRGGKKAGWKPGDQAHKLTKLQIKLLGALHLPKPGQERMQREGWQLDACPLLKPHELSASAVVNPQVTVEAYGGSFAAAGELLDACAHGDVWTSHTKQRNGLNPMWNEHVEVGISHPELAVLRFCVSDVQSAGGGTESSRATGKDYCFATLPVAALRSGYRSLPLRDKNGCLVAFSTLLLHVRQTHTHLPPSLRKEERAGRHRAEGGAQFMGLVEGKRGAKGQVSQGAELKKGIIASFQGKSGAKAPSLEA